MIFLDEPTTGIEPRGRHTALQIVHELAAGGHVLLRFADERQLGHAAALVHGGRDDAALTREQRVRLAGHHAGRVAWFADNQPFTPIIEALRGLLTGTGIGRGEWLAGGVVCRDWACRVPVVAPEGQQPLDRRVTTDVPPARTVCHGCRQTTQFRTDSGEVRPMIIPGSGMVIREKAPGVLVEEACPGCGEHDHPGWTPGFVPPL